MFDVSREPDESIGQTFVDRGENRGPKTGKWPGQLKCNIEGYKDPQNQALYFYKLIPPRKIELPPAFDVEPSGRLF
jgi:hypothetical protein